MVTTSSEYWLIDRWLPANEEEDKSPSPTPNMVMGMILMTRFHHHRMNFNTA